MICTFFGHRDAPEHIRGSIEAEVRRLIEEEGIRCFYVGNNGDFDRMVQGVLGGIVTTFGDVKYAIVLSAIHERAMNGAQERTIFPQGMEEVPARFAIAGRNDWLVKQSDVVVAYMEYSFSNTYKYVQRAKGRGARIIYLSDTANI